MLIQADKQVRLAAGAVGLDSEGLPSAEVPAPNCGAGVPRCRRRSSRGTSNHESRGLFSDCPTTASTSWQTGWSPLSFEGECPPFWEGAPGILTWGSPLPLQQLEAESSDLAAAVAVAAESAGERPAAAAAAAAAGSPHLAHRGGKKCASGPQAAAAQLAALAAAPSAVGVIIHFSFYPLGQTFSPAPAAAAAVAARWVAPGEVLGAPVHAGEDLNPRRAAAAAGGAAAAAVAVGLKESDEGAPLSSLSSSSSSRSNRDGSWSSFLGGLSTPEGPALWEERPLRPQRPEFYT
ncbi:hypothetical protein Efla_002279 [Eimeria flavescens]